MGSANLLGATIDPASVGVLNDTARTSITRVVSDRAIGIKLKEAMRWWGPANVHGGFFDDVMLSREDKMEVGGNGVDFFEDGVTVKLRSLHDRLISCGPDGPSNYAEKDGPGDASWGYKMFIGCSHASNLVQDSKVELYWKQQGMGLAPKTVVHKGVTRGQSLRIWSVVSRLVRQKGQ